MDAHPPDRSMDARTSRSISCDFEEPPCAAGNGSETLKGLEKKHDADAELALQVARLESENSQLTKETRDLERELERRTRMHEGAMLRMCDMQREHSAHVEVLTTRIGSLGRELQHCSDEVRPSPTP